MRDLIALASIGLGSLLVLWCALEMRPPRRPGRHSAAYRAPETLPTLTGPGMKPWPTPVPEHVRARRLPLRGEDTALIRPYAPADDTLNFGVIASGAARSYSPRTAWTTHTRTRAPRSPRPRSALRG